MVKSGWLYRFGMGFWGANGHDGIWHIALIESLAKGSFGMPTFGGERLQNYHIGFDLLIAIIHRITLIPVVNLYFQIIPPILALLVGVLTYKFVDSWTHSETSAFWSVFFVYFGGSLAWLFGKGESAFWSQQAISTLINPPFALSLVFVLLGLIFFKRYLQSGKNKFLCLSVLLFGSLIEVKSYAGLLLIGGLFCVIAYDLLRSLITRTILIHINIVKVFFGTLTISLALFLIFSKEAAGLVIWQPFWFLESMVASSDRFQWLKMAQAMLAYKNAHVILKFIASYLTVFAIFVLGNFGTRIIFLFRKNIFKDIKSLGEIEIMMYSIIAAGILIPTFFVQKGTPWNTIQFIYYSLFFSGILAGIVIGKFTENSGLNSSMVRIIEAGVVLITIPTTFLSLRDIYVPKIPPAVVPNDEISALNFLKNQPDGVVLTYPYDRSIQYSGSPKPLYLYTSTAYVSAFSAKDVYMEDIGNLDITGFDWKERLAAAQNWYIEADQSKAKDFLQENNIKYVYWLKGQRDFLNDKQLGLKNIFENESVVIYKVE